MRLWIRRAILVLAALCVPLLVAHSQPGAREQAVAAQQRGDYETELRVLRERATQGDASAQFLLGTMYADGLGVSRNDAQAVHWYRRAAGQGNARAQTNLGLMYADGRGVPRNEQQAYFWWLLAAAQGDADAAKERDRIEPRLTAPQRAAAQAQASQWRRQGRPHLGR